MFLSFVDASAFAIEKNVSSPDGKVVVAVSDEGELHPIV